MTSVTRPVGPVPAPSAAPPGAFSRVQVRGLLLWVVLGVCLLLGAVWVLASVVGVPVPDQLLGPMLYIPMVAWLWFVVVRRAGVRLGVLFRWPRLGGFWFAVAGLFVVLFLFSAAASILVSLVLPDLADGLEDVGRGNLLVVAIELVVLPPLVEETIFRGVIVERWSIRWNLRVAILLSALAFAVLHVDPIGAGAFGVVTGLLYVRTGSLWPGILIHGANNLVALVLVRTSDPALAEQASTPAESLSAAVFLLALTVPVLAWFIWTSWPKRGQLTPYQAHEAASGPIPARTFPSAWWSGASKPVCLTVTAQRLEVSDAGGILAVLPLERLFAAYPAAGPHGLCVVLLLRDGSWTTVEVASGEQSANRELAAAVSASAGRASASTGEWPGRPA